MKQFHRKFEAQEIILYTFILCSITLFFSYPYASLLLIGIVFSFLSFFFRGFKIPIFIIGCVSCFIYSSISMEVEKTADILVYHDMLSGVVKGQLDGSDFRGEFLFYFLVYFLNFLFSGDIKLIYYFILLFINVLYFYFLYKVNYKYCLFIFFCFQVYNAIIINPFLLRQSLSIGFLLVSLSFVGYKRGFLLLFSIFTHLSSLLLIFPLVAINKRFLNSRKVKVAILFLSVIGFFLFSKQSVIVFSDYIKGIAGLEFIFIKLTFFYTSVDETPFQRYAFIVGFVFLFAFVFYDLEQSDKFKVDIFTVFLFSCIYCLVTLNIPIMYNRVGFLFYYNLPLLLYSLYSDNRRFFYKLSTCQLIMAFPLVSVMYYTVMRFVYIENGVSWLKVSEGDLLNYSIRSLMRLFL